VCLLLLALWALFWALPRVIPSAFLVMALPPYFDKDNAKVFRVVLNEFPLGFAGRLWTEQPTHPWVRGLFELGGEPGTPGGGSRTIRSRTPSRKANYSSGIKRAKPLVNKGGGLSGGDNSVRAFFVRALTRSRSQN